jgi:hypothetical protein
MNEETLRLSLLLPCLTKESFRSSFNNDSLPMKNLARFCGLLALASLPIGVFAGSLDKPRLTPATPAPAGGSSLQTSSLDKAAPDADAVVGRWNFGGTIWTINADGKCHRWNPHFSEGGTWKLVATGSPAKYEFNWSGGRAIDTVYYSPTQDKFLGKGNKGKYNPVAARAVTQ